MKKYISFLLFIVFTAHLLALNPPKKVVPPLQPRVEPMFWWAGMKNPNLQLLVQAPEIGLCRVQLQYPGVDLKSVVSVQNTGYLFINLDVARARPGSFIIRFEKDKKIVAEYTYELREREPGSAMRQGFKSRDALYLIMPHRFANGNPGNDEVAGMKEKPNRSDLKGRHGGDIQGLKDHLDYIAGMGFTAIWLNPILENDMPVTSYHGYATTDFYKVDPRYGTNEEYRELAAMARKKGVKLIMDMIFNHCGSEHWWMKDLPMPDWINGSPEYRTNHVRTVNQDYHASDYDRKHYTDGWFDAMMPDLNQRNPFMATYLIQNSIWWTEYVGLAGIRMDTYPYPDKEMMAVWNQRMAEEYPDFTIVGEEWGDLSQAIISYWQKGKSNIDGYQGNLVSVTDFALQNAVSTALREEGTGGLKKIYDCLANDFQYPDAQNLVIFPDNHDMPRFFVQVNKDVDLFKMGIGFILTTRGIPQLYYGTEIIMSHTSTRDHDSQFRKDFPGGWTGDEINGFTGLGLSSREKEVQDFVRKLLLWRKNKEAIHSGKLLHFVPYDGMYVYFRYNDTDTVMVVLNKNAQETILKTERLAEMLRGFTSATDVISGKTWNDISKIALPPKSVSVFEIK